MPLHPDIRGARRALDGHFREAFGSYWSDTSGAPDPGADILSTEQTVHTIPNSHSLIRWLAFFAAGLALTPAHSQDRIYRCPGTPVEYINNAEQARSRGCTLMQGGNITVIEGVRPQASSAPSSPRPAAAPRSGGERVDSAAQRARDSDARVILETELRRAEERLTEARKAYANGEPEKQGIEGRNHQRYLDRVAELKAAVDRAEADVEGIRREIARLPAPAAPAPTAQ